MCCLLVVGCRLLLCVAGCCWLPVVVMCCRLLLCAVCLLLVAGCCYVLSAVFMCCLLFLCAVCCFYVFNPILGANQPSSTHSFHLSIASLIAPTVFESNLYKKHSEHIPCIPATFLPLSPQSIHLIIIYSLLCNYLVHYLQYCIT
jgi:hypothetical protein